MSSTEIIFDHQLKKFFKGLSPNVEKAANRGLYGAGELIRGDAQASIQKKSPGRTVTRWRGNKPRRVIAAKKGNPPNTDTGTLVRLSHTKRRGGFTYVEFFAEYAKRLEKTHPYLQPAYDANKPKITELVISEIKKVL